MKDYKLKSGNILRVISHPNPESPDKWGNTTMFLVYDHKQFTVKREGFDPKEIFKHFEALKNIKVEEGLTRRKGDLLDETLLDDINQEYDDYFIFPVDAYIHSGINLSLANTKNYPDRQFDVSTTGYILVLKDWNNQEIKVGGSAVISSQEITEEKAKKYAEGLIETWNQYLSGDVYGFQVLKKHLVYHIREKDLKNLLDNCDNVKRGYSNYLKIDIGDIEGITESIVDDYQELDSCWGFYGDDPKTNGMIEHINDEIIEEDEKSTN